MAVIQTGADGIGAADFLAIDLSFQGQVLTLGKGKCAALFCGYIESKHNRIFGIPVQVFNTQWVELIIQSQSVCCIYKHLK